MRMEQLNCCICEQLVPGSLDGLSRHLLSNHAVSLTRGVGNRGFVCAQDGCLRRFVHFFSLRRHIREDHINERYNEPIRQPEPAPEPVPVNFGNINNGDFNVHNQRVEDDGRMDVDVDLNHEVENNNVIEDDLKLDLQDFIVKMIGRLNCNGSRLGA